VAHMAIAKLAAIGAAVISLAACTMTSEPMEAEDGSYIITGSAAPVLSTADAVRAARADAERFCAKQSKRAVAVAAAHQDGAPKAFIFANRGGLSGGSFSDHDADLQFRCI
jgi:hypothetical protein